jgi:predicted nucleic acid-binding protein
MSAIIVDTNVLVYAHDKGEREKQRQAIDLLRRLEASRAGRLPAQVLSEFFSATTRAKSSILPVSVARQQVENFALTWIVFDTTASVFQEAVRGVEQHKLAFYDAQIWASARLNQVGVVLSEDFSSGTQLEGVRFVDPFAPEFDLAPWVS